MRSLVVLTVVVVAGWSHPSGADPRVLSVGIVPQQPAWVLAKLWVPVLAAWSRASGVPLQFETASSIAVFEVRARARHYDLIYLNPSDYRRLDRRTYRVFARPADTLQGILVVRRSSPWRTLSQLRGSTIAFPAAHAFAASMLPRRALDQAQVRYRVRYVGSHDSVYLGVAEGLFPAGGGITQTLEMLSPGVRARLRVIWRSPQYLPHPFAALNTLSPALVARLRRGLVGLGATPATRALLAPLAIHGFVAARSRDYRRLVAVAAP